jgi:predicted component of type VI protein secretion system
MGFILSLLQLTEAFESLFFFFVLPDGSSFQNQCEIIDIKLDLELNFSIKLRVQTRVVSTCELGLV